MKENTEANKQKGSEVKKLEDYHIAQNKDISSMQDQIDSFGSTNSEFQVGMIQLKQSQSEFSSDIKALRSKFEGDLQAIKSFDSAFKEKVNSIE